MIEPITFLLIIWWFWCVNNEIISSVLECMEDLTDAFYSNICWAIPIMQYILMSPSYVLLSLYHLNILVKILNVHILKINHFDRNHIFRFFVLKKQKNPNSTVNVMRLCSISQRRCVMQSDRKKKKVIQSAQHNYH